MKHYDVMLIGTGQATGTILGPLLKANRKIAVIEADRTGGSCVNWGCTPTKTLIASARAAHMVHRAGDFGIEVLTHSTNYAKVAQRVNTIRNSGSEGFTKWLEDTVDFYHGFGSFIDSHTVQVNGESMYGEMILIHTGTRSRTVTIPGIETAAWLDNKGILDLKQLPSHLMILGGSYIGVEFGQAFRRLGSQVTILEASSTLVPKEDDEIGERVRNILEDDGIDCITEATVTAVSQDDEGAISLQYEKNNKVNQLKGSHFLVAVGRVPNTAGLGLEAAGVKVNEKGFIEVDDQCRTSVPHIFALGDVNGKGAFTHTSVHDGQVFLSALEGGDKKISDRIPIYSLFMDPPLARVGMTEKQAKESGISYLVTTMEMSSVSRAREKDETKGLMKILVDAQNDTIIGAAIFGVGGDEVIGMIALAMQAKLPYHTIQDTVLPHPTVGELIPFMFDGLKDG